MLIVRHGLKTQIIAVGIMRDNNDYFVELQSFKYF